MPIDILLVDDDEVFRLAVRRLLEGEGGFRIVGEAADGDESIRLARVLRPEVLVMDITMPRLGGLEATRRIKEEQPAPKVILLTAMSQRCTAGRRSKVAPMVTF